MEEELIDIVTPSQKPTQELHEVMEVSEIPTEKEKKALRLL